MMRWRPRCATKSVGRTLCRSDSSAEWWFTGTGTISIAFVRRLALSVRRLLATVDQVESANNDAASIALPTTTRADRSDATARPITTTTAFTWSIERANAVGLALGQLGSQVFANFDRSEPEWPVLQRLAAWPDRALARLTTICLGITDYQLGAGAAAGYWKAVMMEIERRAPSNPADVIEFMARVCRHPVSSRLADQKLARVEKVIRAWESEQVTSQPVELWRWLAVTLGQPEEAKTVVMAMKLVDLLELAGSGNYLDFGAEIPLPIDLRIARISLTSGLIAPGRGRLNQPTHGPRWRNRVRAPTGLDRGVACCREGGGRPAAPAPR